MDTITVTIDGRTVSGRTGMTIMELAREMGISIPSLCHDESLMPQGACRVCLVEEEKSGALLASCVAPIAPGMMIRTATPRVLETRAMVVKLLLASHPESCLLCDKGNRCQLRQIAADLNIGPLDLYKLPNYSGIEEVNPFIKRDLAKCILCGKCIRADQELVVEGAIDYCQRGFEAKPATLHGQPLEKSECTFCGTCVVMCPTGALSEKEKSALDTVTSSVSSVCPYCACGCAISLGTDGQQVVEVRPEGKKASVNFPTLCVKGHYGWEFIKSPERLKVPLIRKGGELTECSWEEALDFVTGELNRIRGQYGPDALAFLGSPKGTNEENYLLQKLARGGMGTNNVDHIRCFSGLPSPQVSGPGLAWGGMTSPIADLEKAKTILVIGANPEETAPIVAYKIKRAVYLKKAKLILIEPRGTKLAPLAHRWLRPQVGTDAALILGLLQVVLEEELDREFPEKFKEAVKAVDLTRVKEKSGVQKEIIRETARSLYEGRPVAVVFGNGLWQGTEGKVSFQALIGLAWVLGSIGVGGGGFYPLSKESNSQGARDMAVLPDFLPGYQALDDAKVLEKFARAWGRPLPVQKGMTALAMIKGANEGNIHGMFIMGENPIRSLPASSYVAAGLSKLEFLAVQDLFLNETAKLAHVVLPASSFAEKEGTVTNAERRVQRLRAAVEPWGQSLPDWKILNEISRRLGLAQNYKNAEEVMQEISELAPIYRGISYERLEKGGLSWPLGDEKDGGRPPIFSQGFRLPEKFLKRMDEVPAGNREENGFQLFLGSTLIHFGSGTRSTRSVRLKKFCDRRTLSINPEDAEKLGLKEGSPVRITAGDKEVTCPVSFEPNLRPGILFLPTSPGEEKILELLPFPLDLGGEFPLPKTIKVNLGRI